MPLKAKGETMKIIEVHPGHFVIDPGNEVVCYTCGKDFTNSDAPGGIYGLGMRVICPECAPRILEDAKRCGELQYIAAKCPEGMAFADWVRNVLRKTGVT